MYLGISFDNDISSIKLDKITYYDLSTNNFVNSNILEYSNYFSDVQNYLINNFGYILKKYK
jgi:hypothetical protein